MRALVLELELELEEMECLCILARFYTTMRLVVNAEICARAVSLSSQFVDPDWGEPISPRFAPSQEVFRDDPYYMRRRRRLCAYIACYNL